MNVLLNIIVWTIGVAYAGTTALLMFYTFVLAYFTEQKAVLVTINSFGEANVEIVLFVLGIMCFLYMSYLVLVKDFSIKKNICLYKQQRK